MKSKSIINQNLGILCIVIYSVIMFILVFKLEGFNGLKFLSIYELMTSLLFAWWIGHIYVTTCDEKEKKEVRKGHIMICIFFLIIFPMSFGLNQKIAILFFDTDGYAKELQQTEATMLGSNAGQLNRLSGSALHTVMFLKEDARYTFPVACNLLTPDSCEYKNMGNNNFTIKYKNKLSYPFEHYYLIYEIKSPDFYRGDDYHINLYRENKLYAALYLIFIVLASIVFIFLIPALMLLNTKNSSNRDKI